MAASVVQNLEGAQNTALATVTVPHSAATANNLLLLVVGADDYRTTAGGSRPESSGYTLSTGCGQETFLGHYVWWKVAAGGETSVQYTIGSAATSCWEFYEVSGLTTSPYDISNGQLAGSAGNTYTTPAITPSAGDRYLFASMGGSLSAANPTGMGTWLNSFTELNDTFNTLGSGTRDVIGAADLSVTANGSTSYSTGATYDATSPQTRTGIILAFKVAAAGTSAPATEATGAGAAQGPAVAVTVAATEATGAGSAPSPAASGTAGATEAVGSGSALAGLAALTVNASEATGAGVAFNPTATAPTNAPATEATGSGSAAGPAAAVSVNAGVATAVGSAAAPLAGAVLFTTETPTVTDASDGTPGITTATSLTFGHGGVITAVRFYATVTVSGTYTAGVWQVTSDDATSSGTGTLLTSEVLTTTPNGGEWTAIPLSSPVSVSAGVLYRVGVHNSDGRYVATSLFGPFVSGGLTNGDLVAPADGTSPTGLGRLNQGTFEINAALTYPRSMFNQAGYFVDVLFSVAAASGAPATEATGTGTAMAPSVAVATAATEATAAGTAEWDAGSSISLDLAADNPVDGVGTAFDATVSTAASASPAPSEAAATGTANNPTVSTSATVNAPATEATAAGAAAGAGITTTTAPAEATGAGAAYGTATAAAVPAAEAVATGTALDATVSTLIQVSADAGLATGAGAAFDPVAAVQVLAAAAAAVAAAPDAVALIGGDGVVFAGAATGSGSAYSARPSKITPRPRAGTTTRPFAGVTLRP